MATANGSLGFSPDSGPAQPNPQASWRRDLGRRLGRLDRADLLALVVLLPVGLVGFLRRGDLFALDHLNSTAAILGLASFLFGLGLFLWRLSLVATYKSTTPVAEEHLPACTVIVPAYNEGRLVKETLVSIARSDYPAAKLQLIAVDDGSQDDTWRWMTEAAREIGAGLELIRLPRNMGKRHALWEGFKRATGQILVTVDSDSLLPPATLKSLVAPFARDPRVGAVAGNVRVLNAAEGVIPRMLDVNFAFSFDFVRASQSRINTVVCTPGCLSAYRRDVVAPVLQEWLNQKFLSLPAKIGEDRALTNLILRAGFHVHFQSEAVVYTKVPTRYRSLCKMMLRWARSNVRETIILTGFAFGKFRPTSAWGARINLLASWLSMTVGEVFKVAGVYLLLLHPLTVGVNLLLGAVLSALVQAAFYALRHRTARCLWAFPYAVFWIFALSWISLYAWFTPQKSAWLTRGLDRGPLLPVRVQVSPFGSR